MSPLDRPNHDFAAPESLKQPRWQRLERTRFYHGHESDSRELRGEVGSRQKVGCLWGADVPVHNLLSK